jgi:hypothetical protein
MYRAARSRKLWFVPMIESHAVPELFRQLTAFRAAMTSPFEPGRTWDQLVQLLVSMGVWHEQRRAKATDGLSGTAVRVLPILRPSGR